MDNLASYSFKKKVFYMHGMHRCTNTKTATKHWRMEE